MSDSQNSLLSSKNQWLYQQIEVEFPTKESLEGRALYLSQAQQTSLQPWQPQSDQAMLPDSIFLVDFHRLTIMFAQLQAKRWQGAEQQSLIVEFLTQIIYSEPCELYLAFDSGEPIAAAIVTRDDTATLISDLALSDPALADSFIAGLVEKLQLLDCGGDIFIEQMAS